MASYSGEGTLSPYLISLYLIQQYMDVRFSDLQRNEVRVDELNIILPTFVYCKVHQCGWNVVALTSTVCAEAMMHDALTHDATQSGKSGPLVSQWVG